LWHQIGQIFGQDALISTFLNLGKMHQDFSPNHWIGPQKLFVTPKMGEFLDKKMRCFKLFLNLGKNAPRIFAKTLDWSPKFICHTKNG
jgi:hypothetical protein